MLGGFSLQEHRAPSVLFSVWAFSQLQWRADCLPHEPVGREMFSK